MLTVVKRFDETVCYSRYGSLRCRFAPRNTAVVTTDIAGSSLLFNGLAKHREDIG